MRFVQLFDWGWDFHGTGPGEDIRDGLTKKCATMDRPVAALIKDLKPRGLLDETLIIWGGEFGRTPFREGRTAGGSILGRDHYPRLLHDVSWPAAASSAGITHGESDELGFSVARDKVHVHDLQATILHLLGLRPHAADLPLPGPRLPPDRRARERRQGDPGVSGRTILDPGPIGLPSGALPLDIGEPFDGPHFTRRRLLGLGVAGLAVAGAARPAGEEPAVIVLDDADPDFRGPAPLSDGVRAIASDGKELWSHKILNNCQAIGANHGVAIDPRRGRIYIRELVARRVIALDLAGEIRFRVDVPKVAALAVDPEDGNVWCAGARRRSSSTATASGSQPTTSAGSTSTTTSVQGRSGSSTSRG